MTVLVYPGGCISNDDVKTCKNHIEKCEILTEFTVEPEENWILFYGGYTSDKREIVYSKAKQKKFGRIPRYETWIDINKHNRDPHACLSKGQLCQVWICLFLKNG